jgi:hypothetical protein
MIFITVTKSQSIIFILKEYKIIVTKLINKNKKMHNIKKPPVAGFIYKQIVTACIILMKLIQQINCNIMPKN